MSAYPGLHKILTGLVKEHCQEPKPETSLNLSSDIRQYYLHHLEEFRQRYPVKISVDAVAGRTGVRVYIHNGTQHLGLSLEKDPVCCGVGYIFGFREGGFSEAEVKLFMDAILNWVTINLGCGGGKNRRFMINMIETGRYSQGNAGSEIKPLSSYTIRYQMLYDYFKKSCISMNEMLWPNENSHNIIHHIELVFPKL